MSPLHLIIRKAKTFGLTMLPPLRMTWGEIFEAAIADVYGIRDCSPDFIIDVGANIGGFTCFAAYGHPQAQIHAFEPSPAHAHLLDDNVSLNRLTNVTLHRQAVTKDGREELSFRKSERVRSQGLQAEHRTPGNESFIFAREGCRRSSNQ